MNHIVCMLIVNALAFGHLIIFSNYPKILSVVVPYSNVSKKSAEGLANSVDPDQTAPPLHCLPRPVCLNTWIISQLLQ